jgi:hypothetical protein
MDFWKRSTDDDEANGCDEPSTFAKIADFAKDEVIGTASGAVVEYLSGGWLTSDGFEFGNDDEDDRDAPRDNRSFEERLEAELAKLVVQPIEHPPISAMQTDEAPFEALAQSPVAAPAIAQAERPLSVIRRGFGRKGL